MAGGADLRRVLKRDGSEQSFDRLRLTESITAALRSGGENAMLAQQFTETVWVRAANRQGRIETARLAEEVVEVLRLYQCKEAAEAFAWFRMETKEILARMRVFTPSGKEAISDPWDRARLALSLMRDLYLERQVAREVARRVERRLVALQSKHLTGRLVSALAENECRTMGLGGGPLHDENLGIERRQLRAWLGGECLPSGLGAPGLPTLGPKDQDARPLLGSELLARFVLEEVVRAPEREAWRTGAFDLLALGDWMRPLRLWLHPAPEETENAFWKRVAAARMEAHEVQVFWPASRPFTELSSLAPQWLSGPGMHLRYTTSSLALAQSWAEAEIWHRMPAQAFLAAPRELAARLVEAGNTSLQWQPPARLPAEGERSSRRLDQAAAVNLVPSAVEAGALQVDAFLDRVQQDLDHACAAMKAVCERAKPHARPRVHLTPCGLPKAIDLLFPDEALKSVRTRRLLLALRDRFERAARHADLRLEFDFPPHSYAAGSRLAERCGLFRAKDFGCGWLPGPPSETIVSMALDTAPWLELPADALLDSPLAARLSKTPEPRSSAARDS